MLGNRGLLDSEARKEVEEEEEEVEEVDEDGGGT